MVTETFTAGEDFTVPDGVFSLEVGLEGEGGGDSDGGRVVGEITTHPGVEFSIRKSAGGTTDETNGAKRGGDSIDIRPLGGALTDRIAVAAGAGGDGGGGSTPPGGEGGGDVGADGSIGDANSAATGGSQTAGGNGGVSGGGAISGDDGSFGSGGDASVFGSGPGGGGGAGWYGGGGGGGSGNAQLGGGGGGGSNYDDGLDSVTANERGTSTRSFGEGGLVTITYEQTPGAENLQITDTTATSNTLDWDAPTLPPEVDSIDQYRVYRATAPGTVRADYTEVGTTPTPGFEDTGLDNGTEYHYRVGADLFVPEAEGTITITGFRGV